MSSKSDDTLILSVDGYEPYTTAVRATEFLQVTLKSLPFSGLSKKSKVKSVFKGLKAPGGGVSPNSFVDQSVSVSFSGGSNRASYNIVRKFLDMGFTPPPEAVQIEEMLNYFNFYYEEPDTGNLFHCSSDLLSCPWNEAHKLLCLNICAGKKAMQDVPPDNLVFLIDVSGSMDRPDKLPMIKSALRLLIKNLRNTDRISVIAFGGSLPILLEGLPGSKKRKILEVIEGLEPDGPTPGGEGVRLAYEVARRQFIPGGNNRIVLITDGDVGADPSGRRALVDLIGRQSEDSLFFSCLGVGMGDYKSPELSALAASGHGDFALATNEEEAETLLMSQLASLSFCMADSVRITTDFNRALVKEYRLIGFDNRKSAEGDPVFSGLEGGKIGSGHSLLALFEVVPADSSVNMDSIAGVKIDYCLPGLPAGKIVSYSCPNKGTSFEKAAGYLKKMACIALFGMKLQECGSVSQISWIDMEKMAKKIFPGNDPTDKEYVDLVTKARKIYKSSASTR